MGNYGWAILFTAILCVIGYDIFFNGSLNFHFLLIKGDTLIEYLAFWR